MIDEREIRRTEIAAIDRYGIKIQTIVAIEELSELTKELTKQLRGIGERKHLVEEFADVKICLDEIKEMYNIRRKNEIDQEIDKIDRKIIGGRKKPYSAKEDKSSDKYIQTIKIVIAIEELSELQIELTKKLRKELRANSLYEEFLDVSIYLDEIKNIFNITDEEISDAIGKKIVRLDERMRREHEGK